MNCGPHFALSFFVFSFVPFSRCIRLVAITHSVVAWGTLPGYFTPEEGLYGACALAWSQLAEDRKKQLSSVVETTEKRICTE